MPWQTPSPVWRAVKKENRWSSWGIDPVKRVPGTLIQSDEAELFEDILHLQKPGCRSILEELRERLPDTEILYAYGYPIAGSDRERFYGGSRSSEGSRCGDPHHRRKARDLFHGVHGGRCGLQ